MCKGLPWLEPCLLACAGSGSWIRGDTHVIRRTCWVFSCLSCAAAMAESAAPSPWMASLLASGLSEALAKRVADTYASKVIFAQSFDNNATLDLYAKQLLIDAGLLGAAEGLGLGFRA